MKKIKYMFPDRKRAAGAGIKILQFGEGNFLRGFVDEMIDSAVEKGLMNAEIIIVKPRKGALAEAFREQDCYYTTSLRDKDQIRDRIIKCVSAAYSCYEDYSDFMKLTKDKDLRFIVSNTTEAGIVFDEKDSFCSEPPASFPGKLAKFLYYRYKAFDGDKNAGVIILPVELIDDNGAVLKDCIKKLSHKWGLGEGFDRWLDEACIFCSTLVDRIISGYPSDEAEILCEEWGYRDELIVVGELFGLWVIESEKDISEELPLDKAGLPVIYTDNIKPYKKRKVRILNGAHTSFALAAYLMGCKTVIEAMSDKVIKAFTKSLLYEEVIPTIEMDESSLKEFADSVLERFGNPYIRHEISAIALNSVSKWKTRCLGTMLDYIDIYGGLPIRLTFSLAALLVYYRGKTDEDGIYRGTVNIYGYDVRYEIRDEKSVTDIFRNAAELEPEEYVHKILSKDELWGMNLLGINGLEEKVAELVKRIIRDPVDAMADVNMCEVDQKTYEGTED